MATESLPSLSPFLPPPPPWTLWGKREGRNIQRKGPQNRRKFSGKVYFTATVLKCIEFGLEIQFLVQFGLYIDFYIQEKITVSSVSCATLAMGTWDY